MRGVDVIQRKPKIKVIPAPNKIDPAAVRENDIAKLGFVFFNVGFSYKFGNHIIAIPSSNKAGVNKSDAVVKRSLGDA